MNIQEIKDFVEMPKLTMLDEDFIIPDKFKFLTPYFEKLEFIGKQSKRNQKYYKYVLLSDEAKKEEGSHFTPKLITNIVNEYISQSNFKFNNIIDFTAGIGAFIFSINDIRGKHVELWDINKKSIDIANEIAKQLQLDIKTQIIDTLQYARQNNEITLFSEPLKKFDLLVLNPPFNLDIKSNTDFVKLAHNMMSENSKAFIVLPNGFTTNSNKYNIEFRKFLVENKLIEAVFSLEGGIFENTQIPTTMLVLSKEKNDFIKIYDFENLDLKTIRVKTKINPLTKRIYYRDIKDYDNFKFNLNSYELPQNNEWIDEYILTPRRMLINKENELQRLKDNEIRTKSNLKFLECKNIKVKNQRLEKLVGELNDIINEVKSPLLLTENAKIKKLVEYQTKIVDVDLQIIDILKILTDEKLTYNDKSKMRELTENNNNDLGNTFKIIKEALLDLLI